MVLPPVLLTLMLAVFAAVGSLGQGQVDLVVQTKYGPVRGYLDPEGGIFNFYGIPYATPPTGTHRFKPPMPPPVRLYTLDAVETDIICPQPKLQYFPTDTLKHQEDCLIVNVFVPDTNESNLSIYIHSPGGAYKVGYGNLYVLKEIARSKKVIVVTFNYRLGPQGFLCLGTEDVPGNAGLKDHVALLKWVKENIANFGGNPNDITIGGDSAASGAVDLLMLSKSAEGLFHKMIPQSGSSTAVWAVQIDPIEFAKRYALSLNFTNVDDIAALENFYKTASIELLMPGDTVGFYDSTFEFGACIEKGGEGLFLDDAPVNILAEGKYNKVPMLYGVDDFEGSIKLGDYSTWKDKMNDKFSEFVPADLQFVNEEQKEEMAQKIKHFYFGNNTIGEDNYYNFFQYFTDVMFTYPLLRAVKLYVEAGHNQIYLYEYTYPNVFTVPNTNGLTVVGAQHIAQTDAVIDEPLDSISEEYMKVKTYMREIFINFITTGNPVPAGSSLPTWPPVNSVQRTPHMLLNATAQLQGALHVDRAQFWDEIYDAHYKTPVPPNIISKLPLDASA